MWLRSFASLLAALTLLDLKLSSTCWAVMAPSSVSILARLHVTIQEGGVRTNMLLVGERT